jgi:hypothetical protein
VIIDRINNLRLELNGLSERSKVTDIRSLTNMPSVVKAGWRYHQGYFKNALLSQKKRRFG